MLDWPHMLQEAADWIIDLLTSLSPNQITDQNTKAEVKKNILIKPL